tara:strand:+ start:429 stop:662 length:234 start_codon:yes stop_codon:yes gene_type:complete
MRDVDRYYGGEKTIPYRKQLTPKSITARSGSIEENPQTQREGEEEVLVKEVLMTSVFFMLQLAISDSPNITTSDDAF